MISTIVNSRWLDGRVVAHKTPACWATQCELQLCGSANCAYVPALWQCQLSLRATSVECQLSLRANSVAVPTEFTCQLCCSANWAYVPTLWQFHQHQRTKIAELTKHIYIALTRNVCSWTIITKYHNRIFHNWMECINITVLWTWWDRKNCITLERNKINFKELKLHHLL